MADPKIKIKRSSVEGKIPTADQVPLGEVALNTYDGKLFASKNVGIGTTVFVVNPWSVGTGTNTYNTYFTVGNVGIATTNPTSALHVIGDTLVSGVVTATSFAGDGSLLTGITAAGSGVVIQNQGSIVGTASTINFSTNLTASFSSGIATITATGGGSSSQWVTTDVGIHTLSNVGIGTTNPTSALTVTGDGNFTGAITASTFIGNLTGTATTASSVTLNSVGLGTHTYGNYVTSITNGSYITGGDGGSEGATLTLAVDATSANTASKVVARDASGDFSAGTITANLTGTATTATNLANAANITTGTIDDARLPDLITSNININSGVSTFAAVKATTFEGSLTGNASSATYASTAGVATALQNSRTFEITGDVVASTISFDGTGNVSLAATIQPNSVALGTDTTGDYVKDITGTANQITVTSGTGEGSSPTLSVPNQFTAPQDVTVTRDLQVNRNLNVNGNITIGGTAATLFTTEFKVYDPDIVLGFRTDGGGNDVSTDTTANHGGIAIASTEGTPLISLYDVGIGETNPSTYKKFMWFKSGTFSGLGTDAWISNYAIGIGSTQFPTGTRLAAGSVQFTENDLSVVRNINSSGIITASSFSGNASSATYATTAGIATVAQGLTGTPNIIVGIVTATSFVKSGGTSSQFLKADGSVDTNTYLTSYTETDTLNSVTGRGNSTTNGISVGILTATSGNFSGIVTSSGAVISGSTTATSFVKSGGTSSQFLKADGSVDTSTYLTTTGSGVNLTGIVTSIVAGTNITVSGSTGQVTINSTATGGGGGITEIDLLEIMLFA